MPSELDARSQLQYEDQHVHHVYDSIASHFSSTRYKPWPVVDEFLRSLHPGSIGLDAGCGNGKYLTVRKDIFIVASDRSKNLIEIARTHHPHSAIIADTLSLPHPHGRFDFAISIAVIHHLSTAARRVDAIRTIVDALRPPTATVPGGQALIFVWALEQKNSRRGWDIGHEQDVLVPWVLKPENASTTTTTYQRYYHLYRGGEIEQDALAAGAKAVKSGYDRDNWWVIIERQS